MSAPIPVAGMLRWSSYDLTLGPFVVGAVSCTSDDDESEWAAWNFEDMGGEEFDTEAEARAWVEAESVRLISEPDDGDVVVLPHVLRWSGPAIDGYLALISGFLAVPGGGAFSANEKPIVVERLRKEWGPRP